MSTAHRYRRRRSSVDAEGFLADPSQWTEEMAAEIAARERHRRADRPPLAGDQLHARRPTWRTGSAPSIRTLGKASGVPIKELYQLFPKGPGEARRQDRRHPQAARLHLESEDDDERLLEHAADAATPQPEPIEKVSIIISKGSLEGIYPGLIMANGARMEGIEANLFFTFFGLDAINKAKHEHVKVATVGNPGLHLATWAGGIPGVSALVTHKLAHGDGEARHPADPRVHRDDRRLRRRPLRVQGVASTCSA